MRKLFSKIILMSVLFCSCSGCSGCSESGIRNAHKNRKTVRATLADASKSGIGKTIVKMQKENGVYTIPIQINGIEMYFIFDTGASIISISETEAIFLYKQGKLKDEDFIETANFIDANGDISEGTIVILRTVKIGNKIINNIKASVVHNMIAPLLFGQSALESFGKISIDYDRNEIIFE